MKEQNQLRFWYLGENDLIFKTNLEYKSEAPVGSLSEKTEIKNLMQVHRYATANSFKYITVPRTHRQGIGIFLTPWYCGPQTPLCRTKLWDFPGAHLEDHWHNAFRMEVFLGRYICRIVRRWKSLHLNSASYCHSSSSVGRGTWPWAVGSLSMYSIVEI
jgi:hypothetical protein